MSTILKALRRLEEEKAAAQGPRPLREEVVTSSLAPAPASRRGALLAAGAGVVVALGAGAWWLGSGLGSDGAEPALARGVAPETASESPAASEPPAAAPADASELRVAAEAPAAAPSGPDGLPDEAFASAVEVIQRPPVTPRVPIEPATPRPVAAASAPDPDAPAPERRGSRRPYPVPAETASAGRTPSGPARSTVLPRPRDAAPAPGSAPVVEVARAQPALQAAPPAPPAEPESRAPAPTARAAAPAPVAAAPVPEIDLRVERTLWHPQANRRTAVVVLESGATRTVREGDVVDRVRVAEIQPSGVVFERDGRTLRREIAKR